MTFEAEPRKLTRRGFMQATVRSGIGLAGTSLGCLAWASEVEPDWPEVSSVHVRIPGLASEFEGYRIAHLTDIHADPWMTRRRLGDIVQLVNRQRPDAVALTGDFVSYAAEKFTPHLQALKDLKPRDGSFQVLGN